MNLRFFIPQTIAFIICFQCMSSLGFAQKKTFRILDKPIVYDETRRQLSLDYLRERHGLELSSPVIEPKMIVLHWTVIPTIEATFDAFNSSTLPGSRKGIAGASALNVSSQFLIDRDGTIFRLMPDTAFARHVIGLNYCAIGIENIGSEKELLTKAQLKANTQLIQYLKAKHLQIEYLIGHYEYRKFEKSSLWKETDHTYRTVKSDPGVRFMRKIRKSTADLNLKAHP